MTSLVIRQNGLADNAYGTLGWAAFADGRNRTIWARRFARTIPDCEISSQCSEAQTCVPLVETLVHEPR